MTITPLIIIVLALLLDKLIGELPQGHPLVGFGSLAAAVERGLNRHTHRPNPLYLQAVGAAAVLLLVILPAVALYWLLQASLLNVLVVHVIEIVGLYFCLGRRSLVEHVRNVSAPLMAGNLTVARRQVALIVSRDSAEMDSTEMTKASVESLLENANDACFATLFWFMVGGFPAALLHRLSNTLDAMWGYRTERFQAFGWAAARLDDLLNWLPARLGAICFALLGQTRQALRCWRQQAGLYESPNGGVIMAAGAGALGIVLGGQARYHGSIKQRPALGCGRPAQVLDIERAVMLFHQAILLLLTAYGLLLLVL